VGVNVGGYGRRNWERRGWQEEKGEGGMEEGGCLVEVCKIAKKKRNTHTYTHIYI